MANRNYNNVHSKHYNTSDKKSYKPDNEYKDIDMNTYMAYNIVPTEELKETYDSFNDMHWVSDNLLRGIRDYGFKYPSQIQSTAIRYFPQGVDLIAQSQSGSGKTGAFAIGGLSRVDPKIKMPQVIVIANTRDLATQINGVIVNIAKYMNIGTAICVGGVKNNDLPQKVKKSHVIVGTPGKIHELLSTNVINGEYIKVLILDETDVLLQNDFKEQTTNIITSLNKKTQKCFFSATFTKEILEETEQFMSDPYLIRVKNTELSVSSIEQYKIVVGVERNKLLTLLDLFKKLSFTQLIIFVRTIKGAEDLRTELADEGIGACVVHARMDGTDRDGIIREFRLCTIKILIATDLMCRGIDIDDLRLVINYDMPDNPETYLHRVGRSGRYGGQGVALNFCTFNDDAHKIPAIMRKYNITINDMPDPLEVNKILTRDPTITDKVSGNYNYDI
jgi:superfamily II DNA/RNA helicase